jgi:hypothetical protein
VSVDKNPNLTLLESAIEAARVARNLSLQFNEAEQAAIRAANNWAISRASVAVKVGDILAPHPSVFSGFSRLVVVRIECADYRLLASQDPGGVVVWVKWIKQGGGLSASERSFNAWRSAEVVGRYALPEPKP